MPLADRCATDFSTSVKGSGELLFRTRKVEIVDQGPHTLEADVNDRPYGYETLLDWSQASSGILEASCQCDTFADRGVCPHVWATILAADAKGLGPRSSGRRELIIVDADEGDDDDDWDDGSDDPWAEDDDPFDLSYTFHSPRGSRKSSGGKSTKKSKPTPPPAWQKQLSSVFHAPSSSSAEQPAVPLGKTREAWYAIDLAASQRNHGLTIQFFQRETKLNGEFGKLKSLSLDRNGAERFPPDDRELLRLLVANNQDHEGQYGYSSYRYNYYGYEPKVSEVLLPSTAYEQVLPKLGATGRLVWLPETSRHTLEEHGRPVAWDDGPPWRFRLNIAPDDPKKHWRLEGELVRDGEQAAVPLTAPTVVLSGLVLMDDRLTRLAAGDAAQWIAALRRSPSIAVPYKDRWELLQRLWQLPVMPEVSMPPNLQSEDVRLPPQGRLMIRSPGKGRHENRLPADIEFQYADQKVKPDDRSAGLVDADNQRVLVRDHAKERELIASLIAQGARPMEQPRYAYGSSSRHDVWLPRNRFAPIVETLVQAGWIVEAEGGVIRKPGEWRLSVTSGVDWFDLEGECDFDGQSAKLPDLLAALRHGEKYVRLGDGTMGLMPQEWLEKFASLANLGEVEGENVRFRPSQALLLDALLAAQKEVSVDKQFAHIRQKLRSFEGVSPRNEPRGFQGELRDYQKEGLGWLHFLRDFRLGGCLADDMGLGKTVQVLALLQDQRQSRNGNGKPGRNPSLAVVPRSLVFNWMEEAQRFTPNLRVLDYTGLQRKEAVKQFGEYDLIVTTYGTLHRDIAELKDLRFDYAILDEAQAIKNAQAQRAKAARLLQADHRLAMTGTPVENHLGELWSIFEFLNPGMLGTSSAFQNVSKGVTADSENLQMLRRALAPFILRRTKGQVLRELPDKTEQTLWCDLEAKQRKQYQELRDYYRASLAQKIQKTGLAKSKIHVLEALLRLRQAALHPGLLDKKHSNHPSAKLDTLLEQLKEVTSEGHKALVFSQFTSFLSLVRKRLDEEKIVYEYLDGRTRDRQQRVEHFQNDPACPLFLISLKAGGHGLNLTAADYVFILDPWWNPAVEAQAIDRTHRIGQTRNVFAYRLIARDTVEEKIIELQKTKRDLADAIISADSNVLRTLTAEDLEMLLS
jgi:superfamily II DNA or RNA helicase